jgi:hypothetical protein
MKRYYRMAILMGMALFLFTACNEQNQATSPTATPASSVVSNVLPNVTPTSAAVATATTTTATNYYKEIKKQQYQQAYTYLDAAATSDGQPLTSNSFQLQAQAADKANGSIMDFSLISDTYNPTLIITTVTRHSGMVYHSHLQLKQTGSNWKILSLDII